MTGCTSVTDAALQALAEQCMQLEVLRVGGTAVTVAGLRAVVLQCAQLTYLYVQDVSESDLQEMAALRVPKGTVYVQPLELMTLGQFANDLAIGPGAAGDPYAEASTRANVLVLILKQVGATLRSVWLTILANES